MLFLKSFYEFYKSAHRVLRSDGHWQSLTTYGKRRTRSTRPCNFSRPGNRGPPSPLQLHPDRFRAQRIIQEVRNYLADLDKIKWSEGRIGWNISPGASRADRFHAVQNVVNDVRDR